jgi:two-component system phosphate regulon sensor histidine kinase PhoR
VLGLRARLFVSVLLAMSAAFAAGLWLAGDAGMLPWAAILSVALAALLAAWIGRAVRGPLHEITDTAVAIRRGDHGRRMRSVRTDEFGVLGAAIDGMADHLAEQLEAARREQARLRTILDTMVEGVFVTNAQGRIVMTNAALAEWAGQELEGRTAIEAIRSPELHEAVKQATSGKDGNVRLAVELGGKQRALMVHVAALPKRQGVVAVVHDVTELERLDAVRRDFVANASHELRTPLTAIRGFAETLLDGALADERAAKRFVGNIAQNAERLQALVEDLLALSRAESPDSRVELETVDVVIACAQVLRALQESAAAKRQQLAFEGAAQELSALADPRALDQVLTNLVDNAIKYTPDRGRVSLSVRKDEGRVVLEVSDSGPGIPRAHLDRIFERFYRVDKGRARAQGGTGLGLSIVKHFVARMEGEVSVASRVGKGSTFRVALKAAADR